MLMEEMLISSFNTWMWQTKQSSKLWKLVFQSIQTLERSWPLHQLLLWDNHTSFLTPLLSLEWIKVVKLSMLTTSRRTLLLLTTLIIYSHLMKMTTDSTSMESNLFTMKSMMFIALKIVSMKTHLILNQITSTKSELIKCLEIHWLEAVLRTLTNIMDTVTNNNNMFKIKIISKRNSSSLQVTLLKQVD
jgi:hypothetical protein